MTWTIGTRVSTVRKTPPPSNDLGFGKHFADHMFLTRFTRGRGWHSAEVTPYEPIPMDPAACVLHYGQALFEGLKAFRQKNGELAVFRPEFNWKRMAQGAERLCMEAPPFELWMDGLNRVLRVCENFVPAERGTSLYIRPTLIATEGFLGVRPSNEYLFYVILSPVGSYYAEGSNPVKIWVEREYVRAAPGGLGETKAAANYAGSLRAALEAKAEGYSQVLWLDVTKTYVEEVGTMNVFFVIGDEVVTPALDGTILEGGTRQVAIELLRRDGRKVTERKISLQELRDASEAGRLREAFGTGTAAVISPIGLLASDDFKIELPGQGTIASGLYKQITALHTGEAPDTFGWMKIVPRQFS